MASSFSSKPHFPQARAPGAKQGRVSRGLFQITRLHGDGVAEPATEQVASATEQERASAKALRQAAKRPLYVGATAKSISYLDGTLPADFGWDPLGLAAKGKQDSIMNLEWLSYAEVIHGRWAMLAAAGALAPEVLARAGVIPAACGLSWFEAGGLYSSRGGPAIPFFGEVPFEYWTQPFNLFFTMLVAMGFAEGRRLQDWKDPGSMSRQYFVGLEKVMGGSGSRATAAYPGGQFFNMTGMGRRSERDMFELQTKELRHGRLAMLAFLGFMVQAQTTHASPVQNIMDHMASPGTENLLARVGSFALAAGPQEKAAFLLWLLAGAGAVALTNTPPPPITEDQLWGRRLRSGAARGGTSSQALPAPAADAAVSPPASVAAEAEAAAPVAAKEQQQ